MDTTTSQLPKLVHIYQNHHLDSRRWDGYKPRTGDIVISTSYKSGTTWMQEIVGNLIFLGQEIPDDAFIWPDARWGPPDITALLEAQTHRRFIKTHLPLDGLTYYPEVHYIVVGRDARDVFMSFWNHYSNYTKSFYTLLNEELPDRVGEPLPVCPQDIHECWRNWITRGWFEWESEGYPFWSNLHHTQTWWDYRHLGNILFVHYNNMLADLPAEIRRISKFLGIAASDEVISTISKQVTLPAMRQKAREKAAQKGGGKQAFKGGADTFFYKGTNGRWRDILSAEDVALYHATAAQVLTPDCALWLEEGR
jgi:aryl sulfotransferase